MKLRITLVPHSKMHENITQVYIGVGNPLWFDDVGNSMFGGILQYQETDDAEWQDVEIHNIPQMRETTPEERDELIAAGRERYNESQDKKRHEDNH